MSRAAFRAARPHSRNGKRPHGELSGWDREQALRESSQVEIKEKLRTTKERAALALAVAKTTRWPEHAIAAAQTAYLTRRRL